MRRRWLFALEIASVRTLRGIGQERCSVPTRLNEMIEDSSGLFRLDELPQDILDSVEEFVVQSDLVETQIVLEVAGTAEEADAREP